MSEMFSRRTFLKAGAAAAVLGGMSVLLTGCDSSSDSPFMPCSPDDVFYFKSSQAISRPISRLSCSSIISRETVNSQDMMGIELFLYTAQSTFYLNASCFSCEVPYSSQTKPLTCKLLKLHHRDWDSIDIGEQVKLTRANNHSVTAYFPYTRTSGLASNIYTFTDGGQAIQFRLSGSSKAEPFLTTGVYDVSTGQ